MSLRRCPKCWYKMVHEEGMTYCPACGYSEIIITRQEPVHMTFSDRLVLEREYKLWLADESNKIGAAIDGTRFMTMLTFLQHKGLLKED